MNALVAWVNAVLAEKEYAEEKGATAVEYALIIGIVSIVLVGSFALMKDHFKTFVDGISFS